jgi:hypothetical protein
VVDSPEDKAQKLAALQTANRIWNERKASSRDAAHAARVLGAIIKKVATTTAPPGQTPQPSKAEALPVVTAQSPPNPRSSTHGLTELVVMSDSSLEWTDLDQFDNALSDPDKLDWVRFICNIGGTREADVFQNVVDSYLLDRRDGFERGENVWSADLM